MNDNSIQKNFWYQRINVKKHFSNRELLLCDLFYQKTKIYPKNLILLQDFIFCFVDGENYFEVKSFLPYLLKLMVNKIILVIRKEENLIRFLYNLFSNSYVHNISLQLKKNYVVSIHVFSSDQTKVSIEFLNQYFKVLNKLFEEFVEFEIPPRVPLVINYKLIEFKSKE